MRLIRNVRKFFAPGCMLLLGANAPVSREALRAPRAPPLRMEVLDSASGVIVEADTPPASGRPSPGGGAEDTAVRVAVRVRPFVPKERLEQCRPCVRTLCEEGQIIIGKDRAFAFDYVFGEESSQEHVFEAACAPLVQRCFQGYNATVFAYGQARPSTRTHPKPHSSLPAQPPLPPPCPPSPSPPALLTGCRVLRNRRAAGRPTRWGRPAWRAGRPSRSV